MSISPRTRACRDVREYGRLPSASSDDCPRGSRSAFARASLVRGVTAVISIHERGDEASRTRRPGRGEADAPRRCGEEVTMRAKIDAATTAAALAATMSLAPTVSIPHVRLRIQV